MPAQGVRAIAAPIVHPGISRFRVGPHRPHEGRRLSRKPGASTERPGPWPTRWRPGHEDERSTHTHRARNSETEDLRGWCAPTAASEPLCGAPRRPFGQPAAFDYPLSCVTCPSHDGRLGARVDYGALRRATRDHHQECQNFQQGVVQVPLRPPGSGSACACRLRPSCVRLGPCDRLGRCGRVGQCTGPSPALVPGSALLLILGREKWRASSKLAIVFIFIRPRESVIFLVGRGTLPGIG